MAARPTALALVTGASLIAAQAAADDLALVIGTATYDAAGNIEGLADQIALAADVLNAQGYEVFEALDADPAGTTAILADFLNRLPAAERVVVLYAGHSLTDGITSWAVPGAMAAPDRLEAESAGMRLDLLLDLAATKPGRAAVLIGTDDSAFAGTTEDAEAEATAHALEIPDAVDRFRTLSAGLGPIVAPQGVMVATGTPEVVVRFLTEDLLAQGVSAAEAVSRTAVFDDLAVTGFVAPDIGFVADPDRDEASIVDRERVLWDNARRSGTAAGLEAYLAAYPDGRFAEQATAALAALGDDAPAAADTAEAEAEAEAAPSAAELAEAEEAALGLNQAARREIQEQLTVLGYNTRGIDGIFGPGTRGAITEWQQSRNLDPTGFLNADTRALLASDAEARAAEIAAEQERLRAEREAADIAFWRATGATGTEADLRVYLERYPDGIYAAEARSQIAAFEQARRAEAEAADRAAWEAAEAEGTEAAFEAYLAERPDGAFATEAEARLAALAVAPGAEAEAEAARSQAAQREERLGLDAASRALIESQLAAIGYDPGATDGRFDADSRAAIRNFQRDQGLDPTGYIDQRTVQALIVAALGFR